MTPLEISIAIHYAVTAQSVGDFSNLEAPSVKDAIESFVANGLLLVFDKGSKRLYGPSERLFAYIYILESAPLPEKAWINPETKKVIK